MKKGERMLKTTEVNEEKEISISYSRRDFKSLIEIYMKIGEILNVLIHTYDSEKLVKNKQILSNLNNHCLLIAKIINDLHLKVNQPVTSDDPDDVKKLETVYRNTKGK